MPAMEPVADVCQKPQSLHMSGMVGHDTPQLAIHSG
jgi:hypothetical protein